MTDLELTYPGPPPAESPQPIPPQPVFVRRMPIAFVTQIAFSGIFATSVVLITAGPAAIFFLDLVSLITTGRSDLFDRPDWTLSTGYVIWWLGLAILHGQLSLDLAARRPRGWYLALFMHEMWIAFTVLVMLSVVIVVINTGVEIGDYTPDVATGSLFMVFLALGALSFFWRRLYFGAECREWCFIGDDSARRRWRWGWVYMALWLAAALPMLVVMQYPDF